MLHRLLVPLRGLPEVRLAPQDFPALRHGLGAEFQDLV
jgi:hypothetical protein